MSTPTRPALAGASFGLVVVYTSLAATDLILYELRKFPRDPLDPLSLWLGLVTVGIAAVTGAVLGLLRRPLALRLLLPLPLLVLGVTTTNYPNVVAGVVVVGWLLWLGLGWAWRRRRAPAAALVALGIGFLVLRLHVPTAALASASAVSPPAGARSVLWVVFDTVRADHLSSAGYSRDTAPRLAALAAESLVFEQAWASSAWTLPSHASMFTGVYPSRHGCHDGHLALDGALPTVAELLGRRGWETALFAANVWLSPATGLERGFSHVVAAWRQQVATTFFPTAGLVRLWTVPDKGATAVDAGFDAWLAARADDRPFFAFVNYLEAHIPYADLAPEDRRVFVDDGDAAEARAASTRFDVFMNAHPEGPGPTPEDQARLVALYDAGIRADDRHLGALLDELDRRGLLDELIIVVVADHGEALGEDGRWDHMIHPTDEVLRVPMIVRVPGVPPARITEPVSIVDLLPTVLEATGLGADLPAHVEGRSLLGGDRAARPIFAEGWPPKDPVATRRVAALGEAPERYRWRRVIAGGQTLLRGPWGDRGEATLAPVLDEFERGERLSTGAVPVMDDAATEQLRRLGYVE